MEVRIVAAGVVDVGVGVVEMKAPWVALGGDVPKAES